MNVHNKAFSLIEVLVGILIVSLILITGFQTLSSIGIGKVKLIEKTKIEKESYFLAERFFEMIKKGGILDYEEYWNRTNYNTAYQSGHYQQPSGFGNFGLGGSVTSMNYGNPPYYCISKNGAIMGTGGCLVDFNISLDGNIENRDHQGAPQRYGQYHFQFIDYNSDADGDGGDEDNSGEIYLDFRGDDDDLYLGNGPEAFPGARVIELYLKNQKGDERTFFRWNVVQDPDAPLGASCSGTQNMTGSGCLGTIEFLKLIGRDYGYDHVLNAIDPDGSQNDGIIDTWMIDPKFTTHSTEVVAGSDAQSYWKALFPESVNVMQVEFYAFPNKSSQLAWKEPGQQYQIAPYIQVKMTISPSWKEKKKIRGKIPQSEFTTTIGLTDLDFR